MGGVSDNNAVTNSVEIYHNTLFVTDNNVIITEQQTNETTEMVTGKEVAAMNTARAEAEAVYR